MSLLSMAHCLWLKLFVKLTKTFPSVFDSPFKLMSPGVFWEGLSVQRVGKSDSSGILWIC